MHNAVHTLRAKMRAHRDRRDFNRALETASPSMQHELLAAASRSGYRGQ